MTKKKVLIIYHREDNDGVCSAAIIESFIERYKNVNEFQYSYKYYGANYNDLSTVWNEYINHKEGSKLEKWIGFDEVFMSDISFNEIDAMNFMYKSLEKHFHWCDHHKPIIDASKSNMYGEAPGIRKTNQSALLNTWEYMCKYMDNGRKPSKYIVQLSDYDSWQWVNKQEYSTPDAKNDLFAFNTGVTRTSNLNVAWFKNWITLFLNLNDESHTKIAEDCLEFGKIVMKLDNERTTRAINTYGDNEWTFNGEKACVLFTTDRFNSNSFTIVFENTDVLHGVTFKREPNGNWVMSAYNVSEDNETDCGKYLKNKYNGGGHKGAAGCTVSEDKFIELLKTKTI